MGRTYIHYKVWNEITFLIIEWNYLSIPKLQQYNRILGINKLIHPALLWVCEYLPIMGLKLNRF